MHNREKILMTLTFEKWWTANWLDVICEVPVGSGRTNVKETARRVWQPAIEAERKNSRTVVKRVRSYYDESIFSPDGKTLDAKSAAWARQVCDIILEELEENE